MTRPRENDRFLDMRGGQIRQFETNLSRFGLTADEGRYLNASETLLQQVVNEIKIRIASPWTDDEWTTTGPLELTKGHQQILNDKVWFWRQLAPKAVERAEKLSAIPVTTEIFGHGDSFRNRHTHFLTYNLRWHKIWESIEMRLLDHNRIEFREHI